jgi:hypothetical protein
MSLFVGDPGTLIARCSKAGFVALMSSIEDLPSYSSLNDIPLLPFKAFFFLLVPGIPVAIFYLIFCY